MSKYTWGTITTEINISDHSARHEDAGADEISLTGLSGTPADLTTHAAASDPHTGYRLESADHTHASTGAQAGQLDHGLALTGLTDDDHTQYVLESLFDAHTILIAVSDNTPVALAVGEQTLVGRITSGNIAALTAAQVITLLGIPQFAKAMVVIDLSGGAVSSIPILHTSRACTLLKAIILYTEASSADAGVTIEIGKEGTAAYYYTGASEASKALWYELDVTLLQTAIAAGDTVICGCAGGKTGTGEALICIEYKVS